MSLLNRERALQIMESEGLDALIATSKEQMEYFTGFHSLGQWLMPSVQVYAILPRAQDLPVTLVAPVSELDVVADLGCDAGDVVPFGKFFYERGSAAPDGTDARIVDLVLERPWQPGPVEGLVHALDKLGLADARLGLDEAGIRPPLREQVHRLLPKASIRDAYAIIQRIRQVKTADEVERLQRAVAVTEDAYLACVNAFREGISERELVAIYEETVLRKGGRPLFTVIGVGTRGAYPNTPPSDARLRRGDVVRFDIGCTYGSYFADIARTVSFGTPDRKLRQYYDALLAGEEEAMALVRPGVTAAALFDRAMEAVRRTIPHYQRHHVGHGIGIETYDPPVISPGVQTPLEEGMVINLETPYYELGWAGLQVEDTMVVTADGYRLLTRTSRDLVVL